MATDVTRLSGVKERRIPAQVDQPSIAGEIFLEKSDVALSHRKGAFTSGSS